jgi:hypothetical protein
MAKLTDQRRADLDRYIAWLAHEHRAALLERYGSDATAPMFWFPDMPDIEAAVADAPPSSRARRVLRAFVDV